MMRQTLVAIGLAASLCALAKPAEAPINASGSVELKNAGGMMGPITTSEGKEPPLDAVGLSIASDGKSIKFVTTLKDPPGNFATAPVTVYLDSDNNPATGTKGRDDQAGGYEYRLELTMCIEYKDKSTACSGGSTRSVAARRYGAAELKHFKGDSEYGDSETLLSGLAFPGERPAQQYPVDGKTVTASIDYSDINVKSGQTIRLVPKKTGGNPKDDAPKFASVLLTLK